MWLCRSESLAKSVVYVFRSHAQVRVAAPRAPAQPLAVQAVVRPSSARSTVDSLKYGLVSGGNRAGKCRAGKGLGKGLGGAETGAGCG